MLVVCENPERPRVYVGLQSGVNTMKEIPTSIEIKFLSSNDLNLGKELLKYYVTLYWHFFDPLPWCDILLLQVSLRASQTSIFTSTIIKNSVLNGKKSL